MLKTLIVMFALCSSVVDRNNAASIIIRKAAERMSSLRSWSATVTVDSRNLERTGPPLLRRRGAIKADAPYSFEISLSGVSDRDGEATSGAAGYRPESFASMTKSWSTILSVGPTLHVKHLGGRQVEYKMTRTWVMCLVGNIGPLMLWLDRTKLRSFLSGEYSVSLDGHDFVEDEPCVIIRVEEAVDRKDRTSAALRLFIDGSGMIIQTEFSEGGYRSTVTLSHVRTTKSNPADEDAGAYAVIREDPGGEAIGLPFESSLLWWAPDARK